MPLPSVPAHPVRLHSSRKYTLPAILFLLALPSRVTAAMTISTLLPLFLTVSHQLVCSPFLAYTGLAQTWRGDGNQGRSKEKNEGGPTVMVIILGLQLSAPAPVTGIAVYCSPPSIEPLQRDCFDSLSFAIQEHSVSPLTSTLPPYLLCRLSRPPWFGF